MALGVLTRIAPCAPIPSPLTPADWHQAHCPGGSGWRVRVSPSNSRADGAESPTGNNPWKCQGAWRGPGVGAAVSRSVRLDGRVDGGQRKASCPGPRSSDWALCSPIRGDPAAARLKCKTYSFPAVALTPPRRPCSLINRHVSRPSSGNPRSRCRPAGSFLGREGASFPDPSPSSGARWPSGCSRPASTFTSPDTCPWE